MNEHLTRDPVLRSFRAALTEVYGDPVCLQRRRLLLLELSTEGPGRRIAGWNCRPPANEPALEGT